MILVCNFQGTIIIILWTTYKFDKCPKSARLIAIKLHAHYDSNQVVCHSWFATLSSANTKTECMDNGNGNGKTMRTLQLLRKKSGCSSSVIITGGDGGGGGGGGDKQRIVENSIERITTDSFCVLKWFVGNEMNLRKFNVRTQTHQHTKHNSKHFRKFDSCSFLLPL